MFKKAKKSFRQLRIIIAAPSGGGKTYTALRIAKGILNGLPVGKKGNSRIAFIDTENHSSANYARQFDFDVADVKPPFEISDFVGTIKQAKEAEYPIIIIDSGSHAWKQILNLVDKVTAASRSKNSYAAWKTGDKVLDSFLENILYYPGHVIMCLRSKMEYAMQQNEKGKTEVTKVGLAPQMRNGIEYEFDFMLDGTIDHFFTVSKTRYAEFDGMIIEKPDEEFGGKLINYVMDNDDSAKPTPEPTPEPIPKTDNKKYNVESEKLDLSGAAVYDPTLKSDFDNLYNHIIAGWNWLKYHEKARINSLKKFTGKDNLNDIKDEKVLNDYLKHLREKASKEKK